MYIKYNNTINCTSINDKKKKEPPSKQYEEKKLDLNKKSENKRKLILK